jgi:DNA-binding SARP family transcriptional activator/tetratricopeptide (TPR) repeat protein
MSYTRSVRFRVLGPMEITFDGNRFLLTDSREQRVLVALLLEPNRMVSMARLVDMVWDDDPPHHAAKAVRNCVSALRHRLAMAGAENGLITTEAAGYMLRIRDDEVDLSVFAEQVARGRYLASVGRLEAAVEHLRAALHLWRGPALAGVTGRAIRAAVARLDEQRVMVQEECLSHEVSLGRGAHLVDELTAMVESHPLRERSQALLMLVLHRSGRRADALTAYRAARRVLIEQLGIEPGPELTELHRAILAGDPELRPDSRDRPEGSGAAVAFAASAVVPRQVPADITGFVGRQAQLSLLDKQVRLGTASSPGVTTVVVSAIAGVAGVGKTALAVRWAHRIAKWFPDGQLYVNLRGYDPGRPVEPAEALTGFLTALGVESARIPVDVEDRAALYRSLLADRRMLVLADNAATATQVRPLLPGAAGCMVLVTSRSSLPGLVARDGALRIELDLLPQDEAVELIAGVIGRSRVNADPAATATLVERCGYLPLALRIVAERAVTRSYSSLAELSEELAVERDRLDALAVETDESSQVRAVFSWSYRALPPQPQRMFRLLGLHPGVEVSLSAAAALAGCEPMAAQEWLDTLVAEHLLEQIGPERYQLHDLLRAYAAELAEADADRPGAVRRVLDWYLHTAEVADRLLTGRARRLPLAPSTTGVRPEEFGSRAQALDWCEAERANLVAATRYAEEHGLDEYAWRIPTTPWGFLNLRKHWDDWTTTHRIALAATRRLGHRQGEAWTLCSLALAHNDLRQFDAAVDCFRRAADISTELGDRWGTGWALGSLATTYRLTGRPAAAVDCHEQALDISRETGDRWGEGWIMHNLGNAYNSLGEPQKAIDHYRQALDLRRETGDIWGEGWTLHHLGDVYMGLWQAEEAISHYRKALEVSHELGDRWSEVRILRKLGKVYQALRDDEKAIDYFQRALSLRRTLGDRWGAARVLVDLGHVLHQLGRLDEAATHWEKALTTFEALGDPRAETVRETLKAFRDQS